MDGLLYNIILPWSIVWHIPIDHFEYNMYFQTYKPTKLQMKKYVGCIIIALTLMLSCITTKETNIPDLHVAQNYVEEHYSKREVYIPMRDGIKLYTAIYLPKDTSHRYPFLMKRTPYSCKPYGRDVMPNTLGPNPYLMREKYIIVYQDVRGRWMSEGLYDNMRPHIPDKHDMDDIDESSDTYDTIDWLLRNISGHNSRVGTWGISYPGFYATTSAIEAHPALKAVSPQAPIGDFFFDDFHHNGAYLLSYWMATPVFGYQKDTPTTQAWYQFPEIGTPDGYQFFKDVGPLHNLDRFYEADNFFWQELKNHPNYDGFWQKRGIIQHLHDIKPAIMVVGGWFDAEDLYGPLTTYKTIERNNPNIYNTIVMGPWSHGDWARNNSRQTVSNIFFGNDISNFFQKEIETVFFNRFLKEKQDKELPEAYMFNTGSKEWATFDSWPPQESIDEFFYLHPNEELLTKPPLIPDLFSDFVSDPNKPVPYTEDIKVVFTPRKYMADDQRFAARRTDVLLFQTHILEEEVTIAGEITADLYVTTTGTDADWIVKIIDVLPAESKDTEEIQDHLRMGNYHMMVRSEVMRGRFRNSFEVPEPFTPNQPTRVKFRLQDVFHTFKKGHRLMIQIQSTWFPLIDINPQTYVPNIFYAKQEDFQKQVHRVLHSPLYPSNLRVDILPLSK